MLEYIYFVKCPGCDDEHFNFFNEAKDFAMSLLSQKPIITQIEVDRNDFGECVDSCDLGTVWSWEEAMGSTEEGPAVSVFTKDDLKHCDCGGKCGDTCKCGHHHEDPEFAALDNSVDFVPEKVKKPVPADMSISDLVEAMEANEDTVECAGCEELFPKEDCFYKEGIGWLCSDCEDNVVKCGWCDELFDKSECRKEVDLGWLCDRCQAGIMSRGEPLTFRENSYWDFLDESIELTEGYANLADLPDAKELIIFELAKDSAIGKYLDLNNLSIKPTVTKINGSFEPVGHVIDFELINGNIQVSLQRPNGKVNVVDIDKLISAGFFTKPMQRSCPAYELLSAIKKAASVLNKSHAPTRAQRAAARTKAKDDHVLDMLKANPAVADELRSHIKKIEYIIPRADLHDYEYEVDKDGEELSEKAIKKLEDIWNKFNNNHSFAKAAIDNGMVKDRLPSVDTNRNIEGSWYAIGNITFDCTIDKLSADAESIIYAAKVKLSDESATLASTHVTSCYRLAKALTEFFDNDVLFYTRSLEEAMDPHDLVELEYPSLTVTLYGAKRGVDDWDEEEFTDSHVFLVPKVEVATAIWENWITEEDVKDVEGGLETLEDDRLWEQFLETHFDILFEKYNQQILDYFRDEATEDFRERAQEEYGLDRWSAETDRAYDAWRDEKYFGESFSDVKPFLAESDELTESSKLLADCPECGVSESFDHISGICANCGFKI